MTTRTAAASPTTSPAHGNDGFMLKGLDIELTERCNLQCGHCYIWRHENDRVAMSKESDFEFLAGLLVEMVRLGMESVRFTGGEPMLDPNLFIELYRLAYRLGLRVSFSSNGTLLVEEIADMLEEMPPERASISIYGWDEDSYEKVTGKRWAFRRFLDGVGRLACRNIGFMLKYPPHEFLVENRDRLARLARWIGADRELPWVWELTLQARHECAGCKRILECRMDPRRAAQARHMDPESIAADMHFMKNGRRRASRKMEWLFPCRAGKDRMAVDAYGRLQGCLEVRHPDLLYDLRNGCLEDALANFAPRFGRMRHEPGTGFSERCANCRLLAACTVCPAVAWMENGDLESVPEYQCQVMHECACNLGFLEPGENGWE